MARLAGVRAHRGSLRAEAVQAKGEGRVAERRARGSVLYGRDGVPGTKASPPVLFQHVVLKLVRGIVTGSTSPTSRHQNLPRGSTSCARRLEPPRFERGARTHMPASHAGEIVVPGDWFGVT